MVMQAEDLLREEAKGSPLKATFPPRFEADRYELLEEVGQGGMATVYRGRDTLLNRDVAIKVLHPHLAKDLSHRERFRREAQTIARLHHPAIVEVYDFSSDPEAPRASSTYLVMEFIQGQTLQQFLEKEEFPLCELGAALIVILAYALGHAHQQQIIHRDLKPENVMIQKDGHPKLTDFGLARLLDDEAMTRTGTLLGSPAYMAPEQVQGLPGDHRTDLFALGVILYRLICRQHPFLMGQRNNPASILQAVSSGIFPDPEKLRPGAGRELSRIIKKALALEPQTRYQSAQEMREELLVYLRSSGIETPEETIYQYFLRPKETGLLLKDQILLALRKRAQTLCAEGRYAAALDACNRILDLRPADEEIRDLVRQISQRSNRSSFRLLGVLSALVCVGLLAALVFLWRWRSGSGSESDLSFGLTASHPLTKLPRQPSGGVDRKKGKEPSLASREILLPAKAESQPSKNPLLRGSEASLPPSRISLPSEPTKAARRAKPSSPQTPDLLELRLQASWGSQTIQGVPIRYRYITRRRLLILESRISGQLQTREGKRLALVRGRPLVLRLPPSSLKAERFLLTFPKRLSQPILFRLSQPRKKEGSPNARLASAPSTSIVRRSFVIITQPWADITLLEEGEKIGRLSKESIRTPLRLEAGRTYSLEASNPGCLPIRLQIKIPVEGPICSVTGSFCKPLSPERDGTPALRIRLPWRPAHLFVSSSPPSRLYINGEFWAEISGNLLKIPIEIKGTHPKVEPLLMLSAPGYRSWNRRIALRPGESLTLSSIRLKKE